MTAPESRPYTLFLVAGEESGDQLGAGLMQELSSRLGPRVRFAGVGGKKMQALGLKSLFPMEEVSLHGVAAIIRHLPNLLRRQRETANHILATRPDAFIGVDLPGFNLRVARNVRAGDPSITTIQYVAPSVWAYRPGRARKMVKSIDRIMALLPFEPEVMEQLSGPPTTYVGHFLIEHVERFRPAPGERAPLEDGSPKTLLVLPGSRRMEVRRLLQPFGETVGRLKESLGEIEIILPAVSHLRGEIEAGLQSWPVRPTIVEGDEAKRAAFRKAHAALAASGTVTLELALSGIPMIVAYRVEPMLRWLRPLMRAKSIVLSNLVLGENVTPEFIDNEGSSQRLAAALAPLLEDSPERRRQVSAFNRLDELMTLDGTTPNARAAEVVLETIAERQRRLETGT